MRPTRSGGEYNLRYTTGITVLAYIAQGGGHVSPGVLARFGFDSFHDSPSPCPRATASILSVRGPCGELAAVVYLTSPVVYLALPLGFSLSTKK